MKIICPYCDPPKVLGYKCHVCGGGLKDINLPRWAKWGWCSGCRTERKYLEGGSTHSICPVHEKELEKELNWILRFMKMAVKGHK